MKASKKGITLVETIVAMLIVTFITVAVLSLSIEAGNANLKFENKVKYFNEISNIITVFENARDRSLSTQTLENHVGESLNFLYDENSWEKVGDFYSVHFDGQMNASQNIDYSYLIKFWLEDNTLNINVISVQNSNSKIVEQQLFYLGGAYV